MAIRHQPQSEKFPFKSPTTPGLYVTFQAYIIELICLNVNSKIGPRFWSDKKYWGPKFGREVKGVSNVLKSVGNKDPLTQTAFTQIIKEHNIKSLSYKTTVQKVTRCIVARKAELQKKRTELSAKPSVKEIDSKRNSTFVDTGKKGVLAKIREIEGG
ncbi:hypothetical protein LCGC14_0142060 [marine sediment metagenome]|uniref:Uncharacterized protein n=1 Tax=marine sediment metagenome TaxID=412755 RepID=A0A0F9XIE7_9ZZZZ